MTFNYCPPKTLQELSSETLTDGKRFYQLPDGTKLPSVTTVIGATKKEAIQAWRNRVGEETANKISRKASGRGTAVHKLCEDYLNNEEVKMGMPDAYEMFLSIKPLLNRINNIHYQEQTLWSTQLNMAGRVDCIAEFDGTLSVIDFKTSAKVKTSDDIQDYFWQTTAYALMYEELIGEPIHDVVIVMAVQDNRPILFKQRTEDHIKGLANAISYYKKNS